MIKVLLFLVTLQIYQTQSAAFHKDSFVLLVSSSPPGANTADAVLKEYAINGTLLQTIELPGYVVVAPKIITELQI